MHGVGYELLHPISLNPGHDAIGGGGFDIVESDEAYQFAREVGKGGGKYFEFDEFTLIKDVKQLRNALYWVGLSIKKKFSVKPVVGGAYVARVK